MADAWKSLAVMRFYPIPTGPRESRSRTTSWFQLAKTFGKIKRRSRRCGDIVIAYYDWLPDMSPDIETAGKVVRLVCADARRQGLLRIY